MKNYSRFFIVVLTMVLLVSSVFNPITASANAAAGLIEVGMNINGIQEIATVAPYLSVIILIMVGAGYVFSNAEEMVISAENLSQRLSVTTIEWAEQAAEKIKAGATHLKLLPQVKTEMNNQMGQDDPNKKIPGTNPYLLIPPTLLAMNMISQGETFTDDVSGLLAEQNELAQQSNRLLLYIGDAINEMSLSFSAELKAIKTTFTSQFVDFKEWYSAINENMKEESRQVKNKLTTINENVKEEFRQVKNKLTTINENVKEEFRQVKNKLTTINENLKEEIIQVRSKLTTINENMKSYINDLISTLEAGVLRIEAKIDSITNPNADPVAPPASGGAGSGDGGNSGNAGNTVSSGVNKGIAWFGNSNGIFAEYSSAFLVATMIFNLFVDIPIFNNLLIVSASIGLVGVFLGIALNVGNSESSAKRKVGKGG